MQFDEEWAQLRAEATERRETAMQLNRVPDEGGVTPRGGGQKLASTPAEKRAAANTIDTELLSKTQTAGDWADEATAKAAGAFGGWATAVGLKKVETTWESQVKTLLGRLSRERDGLRSAAGTLSGVDVDRGRTIDGVKLSPFAAY
ncbi:hypothetical protein [Streptomyces sp. TRM64462]|uniref:hypothetical protein n=1 Tax=Streptomyces sp. TRM64462 TaxID=2741726 RepID=UPI0015864D3D|nr:hypothetical protein [Streptomyces sp. TRM64462]